MLMTMPAATEAANVVIVDDDPGLRELLTEFLTAHGLGVEAVASGAALRTRLDEAPCDVVVLDMLMPGEDGLSILRSLTHAEDPPGIIMFSGMSSEIDRVVALELGADDYVMKPSSPRELLARIRSVLRRRHGGPAGEAIEPAIPLRADHHPCFHFAGWVLDPHIRRLTDPEGVVVSLSGGEFGMMIAFAEHPGMVLGRDELTELTQFGEADMQSRSTDVKVSRLRRKLADAHGDELVRTVRGRGYMFLPEVTVV